MKGLIVVLMSVLFSIPAYAEFEKITTTTDPVLGPLRHANALDMNVSLQFGKEQGGKYAGNAQLRTGYMYLNEPTILCLGIISQLSTQLPSSFGVEFEAMNLWEGYRGQAGIMMDVKGHPMFLFGVGFSFIGFEIQAREYGHGKDLKLSGFVKVDLPAGLYFLQENNR
jgi:hypothetical protein